MKMTERAQGYVRAVVRMGERVVDATVGNGHDTLFLAELVGENGQVIGFELQEQGLANARRRIEEAELSNHCVLYQEGHENLEQRVTKPVAAVMFNLGYLPDGASVGGRGSFNS